eukprot:597639-Pelagomonas_calceolata.AAC.1
MYGSRTLTRSVPCPVSRGWSTVAYLIKGTATQSNPGEARHAFPQSAQQQAFAYNICRHGDFIWHRHPVILFTMPQKGLSVMSSAQSYSHVPCRQANTRTSNLSCSMRTKMSA